MGRKIEVLHRELTELGGREINSAYWLRVTHAIYTGAIAGGKICMGKRLSKSGQRKTDP